MSEDDINTAMREIRVALLEADVSLPVVKDFIAHVKEQALGEKVVRSIQPGQMVIKIVHDELLKLLSSEGENLNLRRVGVFLGGSRLFRRSGAEYGVQS